MTSRREFLWISAAFALPCAAAPTRALVGANERYRLWLVQLHADLAQLVAQTKGSRHISEGQIEKFCSKSIVPHSRGAHLLSELLSGAAERRQQGRARGHYAGPEMLTLQLLDLSVPAGYGGLFPEPAGSRFPSNRYSVWYMHLSAGDMLETYFEDKSLFSPYALPPDGQLRRKSFPFLLFETIGSTLRLAGASDEWFGAVNYLIQKQYS